MRPTEGISLERSRPNACPEEPSRHPHTEDLGNGTSRVRCAWKRGTGHWFARTLSGAMHPLAAVGLSREEVHTDDCQDRVKPLHNAQEPRRRMRHVPFYTPFRLVVVACRRGPPVTALGVRQSCVLTGARGLSWAEQSTPGRLGLSAELESWGASWPR